MALAIVPGTLESFKEYVGDWVYGEEIIQYQKWAVTKLGNEREKGQSNRKYHWHPYWRPDKLVQDMSDSAFATDFYNHHVTMFLYPSENAFHETLVYGSTIKERTNVRHENQIIRRIIWDIDPLDDEQDCFYDLESVRAPQRFFAPYGDPFRVYSSGRGLYLVAHVYDMERWNPITREVAERLHLLVSYQFGLHTDANVGVKDAHVTKIPYTKNSKNDTWSIFIGEPMTEGQVRTAVHSPSIDRAYFKRRTPVDYRVLMNALDDPKLTTEFLKAELTDRYTKRYGSTKSQATQSSQTPSGKA